MSETSMLDWIITGGIILAKVLIIVMPLMLGVAYLTYAERKIIGYMQVRIGPNRVGPKGWLQPIADAVKLLMKEVIVPTRSNNYLFVIAPTLAIGPALADRFPSNWELSAARAIAVVRFLEEKAGLDPTGFRNIRVRDRSRRYLTEASASRHPPRKRMMMGSANAPKKER